MRYNADKAKASTIDPSKMRIAQLKAFLAERGLKCTGCYEKEGMAGMAFSRVDYVRKVKEAMNEELYSLLGLFLFVRDGRSFLLASLS